MNDSNLSTSLDLYNTTTTLSSNWKWSAYVAAGIPILTLALVAIGLNGMILSKFSRHRSRLSVNMKLTFSLAASDLWASSLVTFGLLANSLMPVWLGVENQVDDLCCLLLALEAAKLGAILTSVLHLLTLAANQCFSIVDPIGHKVLVTSKICKIVLLVLWTLPALGFILYFYTVNGQGFRSEKCKNLRPYQMHQFRTIVFSVIATPMFSMIGLYGVIWVRLCRYNRIKLTTSGSHRSASSLVVNGGSHYRRQMQAVVTTTLIVGTFVLSWFPSILLYLLVCWNCVFETQILNERLVFALSVTKTVLILIKLILNPLIYSCRVRIVLDANSNDRFPTVAGAAGGGMINGYLIRNNNRASSRGVGGYRSRRYNFRLDSFKRDTSDSACTFNGGGGGRQLVKSNAGL